MPALVQLSPNTRFDEEALFREAKRRERRRRFLLAALLVAIGASLGGLAASGSPPQARHTSDARYRPASAQTASPSTKTSLSSAGPYFMPGYFGQLSGHELWAANGVEFYISHDGRTFDTRKVPGLSGDLASSLLAVAPAGPGTYAVGMTSGRGFGTCGRPASANRTTSEYLTGAVAVTLDDGRSWRTAPLPECGIVTSLSLVNGTDGFALTEAGALTRELSDWPTLLDSTTNGGRSWHVVGPGPKADEITFVSATLGFGAGQRARLGGDLERTTNGGRTWKGVALPVPRAYRGDDFGVGTPTFFNADDGVVDLIPGTSGLGRVLVDVTHDGGRSWTTTVSPVDSDLAGNRSSGADGAGQSQLVPLSIVSMKTWVLLLGSALYETTDAGTSWTKVTPDPQWPAGLVTRVAFATPNLGWAFAGTKAWEQQLFITTNAGRTWRPISSLAA